MPFQPVFSSSFRPCASVRPGTDCIQRFRISTFAACRAAFSIAGSIMLPPASSPMFSNVLFSAAFPSAVRKSSPGRSALITARKSSPSRAMSKSGSIRRSVSSPSEVGSTSARAAPSPASRRARSASFAGIRVTARFSSDFTTAWSPAFSTAAVSVFFVAARAAVPMPPVITNSAAYGNDL